MARARSNGGAYAWALVVFGCGFVVSLLVAIIFYTKIKQAEDSKVTAERELATYVQGDDSVDLQPWLDGNAGGDSAFRLMMDEIVRLRSDLDFKSNQIDTLNGQMASVNTQVAREKETIAERELELQRQEAQAAAALEQALDRARQLEASLATVTQERADLQEAVTAGLAGANASAQRQIAQLNATITGLDTQFAEANRRIDDLIDENRYLASIKNEIIIQDVTAPDGEVLSVFSNGRQLFINRGRSQGVMIGMTFEVFDANEVIRLSEVGAPRGKATVEVFDLQDDSATCRVVRTSRGAQIVASDVIANIVYDPNKVFTFYAYGDFDIEFDGGTNDIGRIRNMVSQWGGLLAELQTDENDLPILSPQIDFLVLGQQPEFPEEPEDRLDPEVVAAWQAKVRQFETYTALLDDAKRLQIPVLNQNRFLDLVGYYVR